MEWMSGSGTPGGRSRYVVAARILPCHASEVMIRGFLVWLFLLPLAIAAPRPNVILVITDDLGYGDLSCYGQKHFSTPHLDRMAAEGLRFTRHYAGATVCAPSRCSLMTGRDGGHASIRGNGPFALRPDPEDRTIASMLRDAGYDTALIGKSCVTGNTQTPQTLREKGFDHFYGTTDHEDGHFRFPKFVYENTKRIELDGNTLHAGPHYDLTLYQNHALSWLDGRSDKPFFLVLSLPLPHASLVAPEEALARVRGGIRDEVSHKAGGGHYSRTREVKATYAAMVTLIDDTMGSLLAKLREKGHDRDTLVLFTSDNGSHSEGGYDHRMLDSNGPLRGGKRDLYEGGIRVPFIARWPGGCPAGRTSDHASAFWDFLPTLCDLAGLPTPSGIEGLSYAPLLSGRADDQRKHESLYWEFHEMGGRRALIAGDWKVVQYGLKPSAFGKAQLYQISGDIGERNDLAAAEPQRLADMLRLMDAARVPNPRFPLPGLDAQNR